MMKKLINIMLQSVAVDIYMSSRHISQIKKNGIDLQYVINQTEAVCISAVSQNGNALQYVINQTEAICISAVKNNGLALEFVKNQTEAICIKAIRENYDAFLYIRNQTDSVCMYAVQQHMKRRYSSFENIYRKIKNPSYTLVMMLLKSYSYYAQDIMTDNVKIMMENYKAYGKALSGIENCLNDLLYRPNSINSLLCEIKWSTVSPKAFFLTL
jgi:hypothetical protein